ncbi:SpoIID/LytB domain-containing protein [Gemmatimonadota bacterium]
MSYQPGRSPKVRVRLVNEPGPLAVSAAQGVLLFSDLENGERIAAIEQGQNWSVVLFGPEGELRLATPDGRVSKSHARGIRAAVPGGGLIGLGGRNYRGELLIYNAGSDRIMAINRLPLDEYLRSVVPAEVGNPGNAAYQAFKAQAVTARSYAVSLMSQNRSFSFDLTADTGDQVYRGTSGENQLTDSAVFETAGECLAVDGQVVTSFYHSTCGGRTAEPAEVWGEQFAERNKWLKSVEDGNFDSGSRWSAWEITWSRQQLLLLLKKNLPDVVGVSADEIGEPTDLEVVSRGPSGRNVLLKVETDKRVFQVSGDNIRRVLRQPDGSMLPSTMFDLKVERGGSSGLSIVATGRGFGHGLGLCQSGAIARAATGQDYRKILDHYFPKAKLVQLY